MSKKIEMPEFFELIDDCKMIFDVKERVEVLDIIRLKELEECVEDVICDIWRVLNVFDLSRMGKDYIKTNVLRYGYNMENWEWLLSLLIETRTKKYLKEINEFRVTLSKVKYPNLIFLDSESESFFEYMVDNMIKSTPHKMTALSCVFSKMWFKRNSTIRYRIVCTQSIFSKYWNEKYTNIYKIVDVKKPRLVKDNVGKLHFEIFDRLFYQYEQSKKTKNLL